MDTQQEQQIVREYIFYKKVYTNNTLYDVIQHDRGTHILSHTRFHGFFVFLLEIVQQFQSLSVNHTLQRVAILGDGVELFTFFHTILHLLAHCISQQVL